MKITQRSIKIIKISLVFSLMVIAGISCSEDYLDDVIAEEMAEGGEEKAGGFVWTRAEDLPTEPILLRTIGVGFSYDALYGNYGSWEDVKCQIFNINAPNMKNFYTHSELRNGRQTSCECYLSMRDYVADIHIAANSKFSLGALYESEARTRMDIVEDGYQEKIYYVLDEKSVLGEQWIETSNLLASMSYKGYEGMFSKSFISAVEHVAEHYKDQAVVDSFINIFGTHVITDAQIGGRLHIDIVTDKWRYYDIGANDYETSEKIMGSITSGKTKTEDSLYVLKDNSTINIEAFGGNQSYIYSISGKMNYNDLLPTANEQVDKWRASLKYDESQWNKSNTSIVDMEVEPIWKFMAIIDDSAAVAVQATVLQDYSLLISSLGRNNFFSTSFPVKNQKLWYRYKKNNSWKIGEVEDSESNPMIALIVSEGQYVAAVCHEKINDKDLWVAYPIYEGKLNQACGLGVTDDLKAAYKVRWLNGACKLTETTIPDGFDGNFYINNGKVTLEKDEYANYWKGHPMPYVAINGGVTTNGSIDVKECFRVKKDRDIFHLDITISWSSYINPFSTMILQGWVLYEEPSMFSRKRKYMQDWNYTFIYNPTELDYVDYYYRW